MKQEIKDKIRKKVPKFVFDSLYSDPTYEAIGRIIDNYVKDDDKKLSDLKNIIGLTVLKEIKIDGLFLAIKKELGFDDRATKEITLILLKEIFYPMKNYFNGTEDAILKLGGDVPKEKLKTLNEQMMKREKEMEEIQIRKEEEKKKKMSDTIIRKPIEKLLKEYPKLGKQIIGSQSSITVKGMSALMKPMIKYWIRDYKEKMDYMWHPNIDRVQYVYHDKNTRKMNEEERRQLYLILKSVDEEIPLPYSTKSGKIDFSSIK